MLHTTKRKKRSTAVVVVKSKETADQSGKRRRQLPSVKLPKNLKCTLIELKKNAKQKGIKYNGLTRRIKEIWPNEPRYFSRGRRMAKYSCWCRYRDPVAHGNAVDVELSQYVNLGAKKYIEERGDLLDPCTLIVIDEIRSRGFKPLLSQYCIYDSNSLVKTHLDVLAGDKDGNAVLIELKATLSGDEDSYKAADGVLNLSTGRTLPNSYYHRNMIQLLMTSRLLYEQCNFIPSRAYVMRVGNGHIWCYPMDSQVLSLYRDIYETFVQNK